MQLAEVDRFTALLAEYLDVQSRRAELVASNLANADTPGFRAKELDFNEHLRQAAQRALMPPTETVASGPPGNALRVIEQPDAVAGIDGNTVNAGREMATLSDAGLRFLTGAQMLQARFRALRMAIREGR